MEGRRMHGNGNHKSNAFTNDRDYDQFGRPLGKIAARVNRRRCKSEGLEKHPYGLVKDKSPVYQRLNLTESHDKNVKVLKSPKNSYNSSVKITTFPAAINGRESPVNREYSADSYSPGDYSPERTINRFGARSIYSPTYSPTQLPSLKYQNSSRVRNNSVQKVGSLSPTRHPTIVEDSTKVEAIFTNVERSLSPGLQPCISRKKSPVGILKNSKQSVSPTRSTEGRRRQRAQSESDYICGYAEYHRQSESCSPVPGSRSSLSKRLKDNGCPLYYQPTPAAVKNQMAQAKQNYGIETKNGFVNIRTDQTRKVNHNECNNGCLRTTAIVNDAEMKDLPPAPTTNNQINGASSSTLNGNATKKSVRKVVRKSKTKVNKMKLKNSECNLNGLIEDKKPVSPTEWQASCQPMEIDVKKSCEIKGHSPDRPSETGDGCPNSIKKPDSPEIDDMKLAVDGLTEAEEPPWRVAKCLETCLRPSLFPRVPPYVRFSTHEEGSIIKPPLAIQKQLKWKVTSITPIIVKRTLTNSGFRLLKSDCDTSECPQEETLDWIGIWGKHMKSLLFRCLRENQKMNHFPGTFQIGRKDRLWRNLQKLVQKHGSYEFGIMPKTYVLPHDLKILKRDWERYVEMEEKWIIKPPASARGTGIKVVSRWSQIPKKRSVVVQKYVSKPYLINGSKFDMRLYVLVTSMHPLKIYLYKEGLARFASVKYTDDAGTLHDRFMHLTNYSINRLSKNYTHNEDANACQGHKWTLQALFQYLKTERKVDTDALWESLKDVVIKTIISGEHSITSLTKANVLSRYNCYELFGIDILLDENLKPWLLEVNISPSLHSASPLDIFVKGPLVTGVLNAAQFHVPNIVTSNQKNSEILKGVPYDARLYTVYLSKEERDKHIIYTKMEKRVEYVDSILSTLTPDDVRHLIQAEDELTQAKDGLERIFPTAKTHRYLSYLNSPRYYNRLLDAWEQRHSESRQNGIELLQNLCDIGYHLEVPPIPLKCDEEDEAPMAGAEQQPECDEEAASNAEERCVSPDASATNRQTVEQRA